MQPSAGVAGLDCGPDGTTALPANLVLCLPIIIGDSASAPSPAASGGRRLAASSVSMTGSSMTTSAGENIITQSSGLRQGLLYTAADAFNPARRLCFAGSQHVDNTSADAPNGGMSGGTADMRLSEDMRADMADMHLL